MIEELKKTNDKKEKMLSSNFNAGIFTYALGIVMGFLVIIYYLSISISEDSYHRITFEKELFFNGIIKATEIWLMAGIIKVGSEILRYLVGVKN